MNVRIVGAVFAIASCLCASAQTTGNAGTVEGSVSDPSGAAVAGAQVQISNPISNYRRQMVTDASGNFRFANLPLNQYHVEVNAPGFSVAQQDVAVRTRVPISVKIPLALAAGETSVTVQGEANDLLENVPYAHQDIDRAMFDKLPVTAPGAGLSAAITLSAPGVAADSNGFFHPAGDHAQVSFVIDNQPVSDQQSKQFSTQIPLNALQSMELVTGAPSAEFGDKTSLVVNAVTRSGLGQKAHGSLTAQYGTFGTIGEEATFGIGNARFGNFLAANTLRSGRFLDTPEFQPFHAIGNNFTIFDRLDFQPGSRDSFHLNLFAARNWFQIPVTYDQIGQDQRQQVLTFNIAPGYQHTFSSTTLVTVNPFVRQDQVRYYPSSDPFLDTPVTIGQGRKLLNYGVKSDVSYAKGVQNLRAGVQWTQTRLLESFTLGLTDPAYNPVCLDANDAAVGLPAVTSSAGCAAAGYAVNPDVQPGLVPYDLTRGGRPFQFRGTGNINQFAVYGQDSLTFGGLNLNAGLRIDQYNGLTEATGVSPRVGLAYKFDRTATVLRAAYSRTFETSYNENLLLASAAGAGGLAADPLGVTSATPLQPGRRNQFNAGFQQGIGRFLQVDADYFWKFTDNAFDFSALLNTPIQFPIAWRKSKIDGLGLRASTPNLRGFQAIFTLGHTRARFFAPSVGGLIFNSPLSNEVFRIDHDQAFQQTTHLRYQRRNNGAWAAFTWRYDSGLVAGTVPDLESALALSAAQQAAIGFYCGDQRATVMQAISACSGTYGATRLQIPAPGTADADHNPPRIAPRHVFDLGAGHDNLLHTERVRLTARLTINNLSNVAALYNFLSTFSGTHWVTPRTFQGEIGIVF